MIHPSTTPTVTALEREQRCEPALSVVVPVHNESGNIEPLVAEIDAALQGKVAFEIVYVDDASSDDTAAVLQRAQRRHPALRVVRHAVNSGQSTALATGVRHALAPVVATLDGDGQNDPADIPLLWQRWQAERQALLPTRPLLLAGWRVQRNDDWLRRLSSRVANGVRSRLLGDATPDTGCGLKMFERAVFLRLPFFDHLHRFMPALLLREGGHVVSVPVNHRARSTGRSHYGVFDRLGVGIVDILGVMWLRRRMKLTAATERPAAPAAAAATDVPAAPAAATATDVPAAPSAATATDIPAAPAAAAATDVSAAPSAATATDVPPAPSSTTKVT